MPQNISLNLSKIDWPWVGVGFCFYVVFHLLPTYLLVGIGGGMKYGSGAFGVWMFTGLALIGLYIGYRSRGVTIIEPGLSALAYVIVFSLATQQFWGTMLGPPQLWNTILWLIATVVIAVGSAYIGEHLQAWKEQKNPKASA